MICSAMSIKRCVSLCAMQGVPGIEGPKGETGDMGMPGIRGKQVRIGTG